MSLGSLLSLATLLYKKLRAAPTDVRALLLMHLREVQETGLIPLGMRTDDGDQRYVWLLFDRSRLPLTERERYVRARTPPGVRTHTIEI